jgi:hypothetical protein
MELEGYIRAAEELGHALGSADVFPPLPVEVFSAGFSSEGPAAWANLRESQWKNRVPSGIQLMLLPEEFVLAA